MNQFIVLVLSAVVIAATAQGTSVCNTTLCVTQTVIPSTTIKPISPSTNLMNNTRTLTIGVATQGQKDNAANNSNANLLKTRLNAVGEKCRKEVGAQQDILALLSNKAVPTNEKQRCFLECVYKDLGLVKDNKLNVEGATALAKQRYGTDKDKLTKVDALLKKCKIEAVIPKDSTERCALGRLIRSCVVNNAGDLQVFTKIN